MTYVMSDIHGDLDRFRSVMDQINLKADDHLYVLGDVIDGYPYGLDILYELRDMPNATVLLGNHEKMCYASMVSDNGSRLLSNWIKNGGQVTMNALFRMETTEIEEIIDRTGCCSILLLLKENMQICILKMQLGQKNTAMLKPLQ